MVNAAAAIRRESSHAHVPVLYCPMYPSAMYSDEDLDTTVDISFNDSVRFCLCRCRHFHICLCRWTHLPIIYSCRWVGPRS